MNPSKTMTPARGTRSVKRRPGGKTANATPSITFQNVFEKLQKSPKRQFLLLAETFQAMGDSSRVQIVWALSHGELCVGDVASLLSMSQPSVSHHLRTLRNLRLVRVRRDGRTSFYRLDDDHIERLLQEGFRHVEDLAR